MQRTGYSEPVVDYALDRLFGGIRADDVRAVIASELGSLAALDGFVTRPGRPDVYFRGVPRSVIVSSQTTIGVAIPPLVFALCAKTQVLVKDRADALVASFVETILEEEPRLAEHVSVESWTGEDEPASRARLGSADVVVAFGGDAALLAIRAQLAPQARFVPFGHRTSVGYIAREALANESAAADVARAIALDALLYDGEGCLSLHAVFIERGAAVDPAAFAIILSRAFEAHTIEFPAGNAEPRPDLVAYRRASAFRASQGRGELYGAFASGPRFGPGPATSASGPGFQASANGHVIVLDAPFNEPPPLLPGTLALCPVDGPLEALAYLQYHKLALEAFARAEDLRDDVAELALASGASRLARFGTLQDPPLAGDHGGEGRISPFVHAIYRA